MTPVRCVCGKKPQKYQGSKGTVGYCCSDYKCWWGPFCRSETKAIAAWNAVMIPATTAKVQARNLRKLGKK